MLILLTWVTISDFTKETLKSEQFICSQSVFKNFQILTGKQMCRISLLIKLKVAPSQVLSYKFCKTFKNSFFTEHVRKTASVCYFVLVLTLENIDQRSANVINITTKGWMSN